MTDLGYLTFGLVLEALGKNLTASPLLASALVERQRPAPRWRSFSRRRPGVVDGSIILSLAVDEGAATRPKRRARRRRRAMASC